MKAVLSQLLPQQPPGQPAPMPGAGEPTREQLLAQLHDVISPEAVSWWPLAPGWWLLIIIFVTLTALGITYAIHRRKARMYRTYALRALGNLSENSDPSEFARQTTEILKRCFLAAYPYARTLAARTYGKTWFDLLKATANQPANLPEINWHKALYSPESSASNRDIQAFAKSWIKHHKSLSKPELEKCFALIDQHNEVNHVSV